MSAEARTHILLKNRSLEIQMHGQETEIEYMTDILGFLWRGPIQHDGTQMPWARLEGFRDTDGGPIWVRRSSSRPTPSRVISGVDELANVLFQQMEKQRLLAQTKQKMASKGMSCPTNEPT